MTAAPRACDCFRTMRRCVLNERNPSQGGRGEGCLVFWSGEKLVSHQVDHVTVNCAGGREGGYVPEDAVARLRSAAGYARKLTIDCKWSWISDTCVNLGRIPDTLQELEILECYLSPDLITTMKNIMETPPARLHALLDIVHLDPDFHFEPELAQTMAELARRVIAMPSTCTLMVELYTEPSVRRCIRRLMDADQTLATLVLQASERISWVFGPKEESMHQRFGWAEDYSAASP